MRPAPQILRPLVLAVAAALLASVLVTLAPAQPAPAGTSWTQTSTETSFLQLLNQERVKRGLNPLVSDGALAPTSRTWSGTMSLLNSLLHDPNLRAIVDSLGIPWQRYGENVGRGGSVQSIHDAFMASSPHRANVLSSEYNRVGIGTAQSGSGLYVTVRFLEAAPISGVTGLGQCASAPSVGRQDVVAADVNHDARDDFILNPSGTSNDRVLTAKSPTQFATTPTSVYGDYIAISGDFNGDNREEIFWYAPGAAPDHLSRWTGSSFASIPQRVSGRYRPVTGDLDGDGRDDIVWYSPGPARDYIWYGTATHGRFASYRLTVSGGYRPAVTDLDGDGRQDILWYGPGSAPDYIHYSTGRGRHQSVRLRVSGNYRPVTGDFDGSGSGDVLWYAPGSAPDYLWYGGTSRGSFRSLRTSVHGTYRPVAGDFNGDCRTDVAWIDGGPNGSPMWLGTATPGNFSNARIAVS